jgi:murein DD-endopeptidase MepM/ murein hydrolase activator NlpD
MPKDYDDMNDDDGSFHREKGGSSNKKILMMVVLLGIAICVVVVLIGWNKFFPAETTPKVSQPMTQVTPSESKPLEATTPQAEKVHDAPVVTPPEPKQVEAVVKPSGQATPSNTAVSLSDTKSVAVGKNMVQFVTHKVAEGEDLATIAKTYGLKIQTIVSVNQIRNVNAIQPGIEIRIPDRDGQMYEVKDGDMLSTIARSYNLGWKSLMEVNGLNNEMIKPGQQLFIPDATASSSSALADIATVSFQKPVSGAITGKYGQLSGDPADAGALDGILIEGKAGDAVKAAADGDVVDAGYEQKGKGRFVVINHGNGYRTTYAHLDYVEVKSGAKVSKGQVLGSIGTSGTTYKVPTLYFSIEQNGISLNPVDFF